MKVAEEVSQKIKNMSIMCAMLVVVIHVDWPHESLSFTWFVHYFIKEGIARIAVPFFFVVSGFFLAKHMGDGDWYVVEVRKRINSLVIPFFVWIGIATIFIMPLSIAADYMARRSFGTSLPFSNGRWIRTLGLDLRYAPSCVGALWYVRCLFLFVVLSPLFKWLVSKGGVGWLWCAFVLALANSSWGVFPSDDFRRIFSLGLSLSGVFYFSVGVYLGVSRTNHRAPSFVGCMLAGILLLVANAVFMVYRIKMNISLITVAIPFVMLSLWRMTPSSCWPNALTSFSFPLFLMHMPFLDYFSAIVRRFSLCGGQVCCILTFLCAIFFPFEIYSFLRKYYPRFNVFLFSGRG